MTTIVFMEPYPGDDWIDSAYSGIYHYSKFYKEPMNSTAWNQFCKRAGASFDDTENDCGWTIDRPIRDRYENTVVGNARRPLDINGYEIKAGKSFDIVSQYTITHDAMKNRNPTDVQTALAQIDLLDYADSSPV